MLRNAPKTLLKAKTLQDEVSRCEAAAATEVAQAEAEHITADNFGGMMEITRVADAGGIASRSAQSELLNHCESLRAT